MKDWTYRNLLGNLLATMAGSVIGAVLVILTGSC